MKLRSMAPTFTPTRLPLSSRSRPMLLSVTRCRLPQSRHPHYICAAFINHSVLVMPYSYASRMSSDPCSDERLGEVQYISNTSQTHLSYNTNPFIMYTDVIRTQSYTNQSSIICIPPLQNTLRPVVPATKSYTTESPSLAGRSSSPMVTPRSCNQDSRL